MICLNKKGTSTLSNLDPMSKETAISTLILNFGLSLGQIVLNNDRIMNNSDVDTFLPRSEYDDESDLSSLLTGFGILFFAGVGLASLGPWSNRVVLVNVRIGDCCL